MGNSKIIVGSEASKVCGEIASRVSRLRSNTITKLPDVLLANLRNHLDAKHRSVDSVYGLNIKLGGKAGMTHSGWLYSKFFEMCKTNRIENEYAAAIYSEGYFKSLEQFSLTNESAILIGFGTAGETSLQSILDAEERFDPSRFDSDGFLEE